MPAATSASETARCFSAILLAGGQSTRMGRDKAALDFHGESLLRHQAEKLRRLGIEDLVIAGGKASLPGVRTVQDRFPGHGPLGGLHAGLEQIENPSALVLPVDTPLVPEVLLLELLESGRCSVRRLLDAAGCTAVEYRGSPEGLANCNTPEEYARVLKLHPSI